MTIVKMTIHICTDMHIHTHTNKLININDVHINTQREKHALIHKYTEFDASNLSNSFLAMPVEVTHATKDI